MDFSHLLLTSASSLAREGATACVGVEGFVLAGVLTSNVEFGVEEAGIL